MRPIRGHIDAYKKGRKQGGKFPSLTALNVRRLGRACSMPANRPATYALE